MQEFATPLGNFKNLRPVVLTAEPPLIPPPGLYTPCNNLIQLMGIALIVKDLTFIEDGNDDYLEDTDNVLNCDKLFMLGKIVTRVRKIQAVYYHFKWVDVVHAYIDSVKPMNEEEMENASRRLESKAGS